jgi:hypothetical protein
MTNENPHRIVADAGGAEGQTRHNQPNAPPASFQPPAAMLDWALRYTALQWVVFPLHSIFDGKCGCGNEKCRAVGKHPRVKWSKLRTADPVAVESWWRRWPHAGIGCATGPSGLAVFDLDGPKGLETFRNILNGSSVQLPLATARSKTARGWHVFFRAPEGGVPTSSNPETKLDVRGNGGFVVLPPSPHATGFTYAWEREPWE